MMNKLFLILALLAGGAFADSKSVTITASSGSPIPTAYSTGAQSQVTTSVGTSAFKGGLMVINATSTNICFDTMNNDAVTLPDGTREVCVPSAAQALSFSPSDRFPIGKTTYLRSASGSTITSGTVTFIYW